MHLSRWIFICVVGLSVAACNGVAGVGTPPPPGPADSVVNAVVISPDHLALVAGQTMPLAASVDAGRSVAIRTVFWTSSDTTIATVSTAGYVTGRNVGHATISATSNADHTKWGMSDVQVTGPTVALTNQRRRE